MGSTRFCDYSFCFNKFGIRSEFHHCLWKALSACTNSLSAQDVSLLSGTTIFGWETKMQTTPWQHSQCLGDERYSLSWVNGRQKFQVEPSWLVFRFSSGFHLLLICIVQLMAWLILLLQLIDHDYCRWCLLQPGQQFVHSWHLQVRSMQAEWIGGAQPMGNSTGVVWNSVMRANADPMLRQLRLCTVCGPYWICWSVDLCSVVLAVARKGIT